MKRKTIEIMLLTIGIVLMAYSSVSNSLAQSTATNVISTYQDQISGLDSDAKDTMQSKIDEYNQKVIGEKQVNITLEDDYENYEQYYNTVDINGLIGYISIPKININLPIYHGVSNATLMKGIGHLKETSLPYGGESTHAALAGHTGLSKQKMFDDIDKLVEGDEFQIYILDKVLTYKVDKISVVDPNDVSQIQIEEGKDYVTLITCTPRLVNTHRLLVRGERVPEKIATPTEEAHKESELDLSEIKKNEVFSTIRCVSAYFVVFIILLLYILSEPTRKVSTARSSSRAHSVSSHNKSYEEYIQELNERRRARVRNEKEIAREKFIDKYERKTPIDYITNFATQNFTSGKSKKRRKPRI